MPNWQPNRQDVRWNQEAARQAIAALNHAADELARTAQEREVAAHQATAQWRGRHRQTFDERLRDTQARARDLAEDYRAAARRIAQASDHARDEQLRREQDRQRWQREQDDENRRNQ